MGRRQKGKHLKRKKSWHRLGEGRRNERAQKKLDRALKRGEQRG